MFELTINGLRKEFLMQNERNAKLGRKDRMGNDVEALGETNWTNITRNRSIWQHLLRKAMAQK
jgi:hypothetical protein